MEKFKVYLTDGTNDIDERTVTQEEYEELQNKVARITDGLWTWIKKGI
jgi:hypothetical protein